MNDSVPNLPNLDTLHDFTQALGKVSDFIVTNTAREQANKMAREGNPYLAALIRELCNRIDKYEEKSQTSVKAEPSRSFIRPMGAVGTRWKIHHGMGYLPHVTLLDWQSNDVTMGTSLTFVGMDQIDVGPSDAIRAILR